MIVIIITILITKNIYITIVLQKPKSTRSLLNTLKSHRQKHVFILFLKMCSHIIMTIKRSRNNDKQLKVL